jgi:hypothetical protein
MLIAFNVGNYRSFKDVVTLSMMAAKLKSKDKALDENNVFQLPNSLPLLKSAAIYGANASGKSNLVRAIRFMRSFVLNSSKDTQTADPIEVEIFRLSSETENKPSSFEVIFWLDGKQFRYGFTADTRRVHEEWLYHVPKVRESALFVRDGGNFSVSSLFKEGRGLTDKTRDNALFLSVVAQFNGPIAQAILGWFWKLGIISGLSDQEYRPFTLKQFQEETHRKEIVSFVKQLDLGLSDIMAEEVDISEANLPKGLVEELMKFFLEQAKDSGVTVELATVADIITLHKKYNGENRPTSLERFILRQNESEGTKKIFYLSGPLLDTLQTGRTLIVDELDARLHPLITCAIIRLFNSKVTNPHNAQLIFATHDTNMLSNEMFRRDQIWFTEKDQYGATDLYSLAEYKIRNDASFKKDYIAGRYGAIPFIGGLEHLVSGVDGEE